jgi:hypothetical protein
MAPTLNLDDIRAVLSDEIAGLREGRSSPAQVSAITNATGKILSSMKLEMEYMRLSGRKVNIAALNGGDDGKGGTK